MWEPTGHFARCYSCKRSTTRFESLELFSRRPALGELFAILVVVTKIRVQTPIGVTLSENIERRQRFS